MFRQSVDVPQHIELSLSLIPAFWTMTSFALAISGPCWYSEVDQFWSTPTPISRTTKLNQVRSVECESVGEEYTYKHGHGSYIVLRYSRETGLWTDRKGTKKYFFWRMTNNQSYSMSLIWTKNLLIFKLAQHQNKYVIVRRNYWLPQLKNQKRHL